MSASLRIVSLRIALLRTALVTSLLAMCGCCVPAPVACGGGEADPGLASEYMQDAQAATADADPTFPSLAAFEQEVLRIRAEWDERLREPAKLLSYQDFSTEEMQKLRAQARAQDYAASLAEDLTVPRVLAGVFERNPKLKVAHRKLAATVEQYAQVTYLDTIMRQYASFARNRKLGVGPAVPMDMRASGFPFPGTLALKSALVGYSVEEAQARYDGTLRDVVTDMRVAYADYLYLAKAISVTSETISYLRQLEDVARSKLSTGAARKTHVIQTQVQIAQLENQLITLRRTRDTSRARINTLLDLDPEGRLAEPRPVPMAAFPRDVESLYERGLTQQPDLLVARARAARMATMIELAEQMTYPDLSLGLGDMAGLSFTTGGSQKEKQPFSTMPMAKPDPWFGTNDAYLREARERQRGAEDMVEAVVDRMKFKIKDAYNQLDTAKRLHDLYTGVQIAQAAQAYEDASSGYSAGRVGFLSVIDALRQYLKFQLDADRALRSYHQGHARLEAAVGRRLTSSGK